MKINSRHFTNTCIKSIKKLHTKSHSKNIIDRSETDQGIVMCGTKEHKTPKELVLPVIPRNSE